MSIQNKIEQATTVIKPSREEAEKAVRTLYVGLEMILTERVSLKLRRES